MERELKISITIFLIVLIYGLGYFFNYGTFISPFYLFNPLLVFGASLTYFVLNLKMTRSYELALVSLAFLLYALQEPVTIALLVKGIKLESLAAVLDSFLIALGSMIVFFFVVLRSLIYLYRETKNSLLVLIPATCIVLVLLLFLTDYYILQTIFMMTFCVSYFYIAQRKTENPSSIARIVSSVYLLFFLLESVEILG